jgi:hypothetical protein
MPPAPARFDGVLELGQPGAAGPGERRHVELGQVEGDHDGGATRSWGGNGQGSRTARSTN